MRWKQNLAASVDNKQRKGKGKISKPMIECDLRSSDDVGNYVCGLLYYVSLLWFYAKDEPGRVLFLHVPSLQGEVTLGTGRDMVVTLIKAVLEHKDNS